jgi:hypothetical protein
MSSNEGGVVDEIAQGFNDAAIYIEANASPFHRWNSGNCSTHPPWCKTLNQKIFPVRSEMAGFAIPK